MAKFLGVSQSCISDAKKRMAIPAEWLLKLLKKQGINPDWVRSGMGAQYLHPGEPNAEFLPNSIKLHNARVLFCACQKSDGRQKADVA